MVIVSFDPKKEILTLRRNKRKKIESVLTQRPKVVKLGTCSCDLCDLNNYCEEGKTICSKLIKEHPVSTLISVFGSHFKIIKK